MEQVRQVIAEASRWQREGVRFAVATVIRAWDPAPRGRAWMLVSADGEVVGSVSGGWIEAAVFEAARYVVESGPSPG